MNQSSLLVVYIKTQLQYNSKNILLRNNKVFLFYFTLYLVQSHGWLVLGISAKKTSRRPHKTAMDYCFGLYFFILCDLFISFFSQFYDA